MLVKGPLVTGVEGMGAASPSSVVTTTLGVRGRRGLKMDWIESPSRILDRLPHSSTPPKAPWEMQIYNLQKMSEKHTHAVNARAAVHAGEGIISKLRESGK